MSEFWKLFEKCRQARLIRPDANPAVYALFFRFGKGWLKADE